MFDYKELFKPNLSKPDRNQTMATSLCNFITQEVKSSAAQVLVFEFDRAKFNDLFTDHERELGTPDFVVRARVEADKFTDRVIETINDGVAMAASEVKLSAKELTTTGIGGVGVRKFVTTFRGALIAALIRSEDEPLVRGIAVAVCLRRLAPRVTACQLNLDVLFQFSHNSGKLNRSLDLGVLCYHRD